MGEGRPLHLDLGEMRYLTSNVLGKTIDLYKEVRIGGFRTTPFITAFAVANRERRMQ
jgi:hypothetical protein